MLGHEVAHATAEHAAERIEREHLTNVAAAIVAGGVAFTPGQYSASWRCSAPLRLASVQPITGVRGGPHRTRLHGEGGLRPAPGGGLLEAHAAGVEGKEPPEFLSDHPSDEHRIERIEKWLPEAERAYTPLLAPDTDQAITTRFSCCYLSHSGPRRRQVRAHAPRRLGALEQLGDQRRSARGAVAVTGR